MENHLRTLYNSLPEVFYTLETAHNEYLNLRRSQLIFQN